MEHQTCAACNKNFPANPEGGVVVCPYCGSYLGLEGDTSVIGEVPSSNQRSSSESTSILFEESLPPSSPSNQERSTAETSLGIHSNTKIANPTVSRALLTSAPTEPDSKLRTIPVNKSAWGQIDEAKKSRTPRQSNRLTQVLLISYSSIVTLLAIYFAWRLLVIGPRKDRLDLPDLAPPKVKEGQETTLIHVRPDLAFPQSHIMRIGESKQFGNVVVTAKGIVQGPLQFQHFDPTATTIREPTGNLLQLQLELHNASKEMSFVPLDRALVFTREDDPKTPGLFKSNNWIAPLADGKPKGALIPVFDLSPESNWNIVAQNLDSVVQPGETLTTFIPSAEGAIAEFEARDAGEWAWRFHLRKGHNPNSLRGVTTMIEVRFTQADVSSRTNESPPFESS